MSRKALNAISTAVIAMLGLLTTGAVADSSAHKTHRSVHPSAYAVGHQHRNYAHGFYGPSFRPVPAYGAAPDYRWGPGGHAYRGPGYTFVPHHGIVDEACNLPTSACTNEMRDIP
jgi:hypothetical protein